MKITRIVLGIIIILSCVLRLTHITSNPPSLSWDEISIGYNAYTILTHGVDEHGVHFPLGAFAAFGDYKPTLPVYLTVPFIIVFGLSELALRLPSALFGIMAVWLIYFLILELFKDEKFIHATYREALGLLGAFLLCISPWHILLSRAGFEANIATFFTMLGVYMLFLSRKNARILPYALLPFIAGMYTFNSARYAGPLIALGAIVYSQKFFSRVKPLFFKAIVIAIVALLPLVPHLLSNKARLRFQEVSIFTDLRVVLTANARSLVDGNTLWSKIIHNRRIGYSREYLVHFFDNLEPRFLFIKGDGNPKFSIQDTGQLLLVTAPFIFYGWIMIFVRVPTLGLLLLWWLLSSIAPAAVARETPHALRIENGLPVWIMITAYGMVQFVQTIKAKVWQRIVVAVVSLLVLFNFGYFYHTYTTHYPKEYSGEWQYGYREAIQYAEGVKDSYDQIVLTESIGRPYIYALFYGKYDYVYFQKTVNAAFDAEGFYNVYRFGKYRFVRALNEQYVGRTLYILPPSEVPPNAHILKNILLLNGSTVLVIFEL